MNRRVTIKDFKTKLAQAIECRQLVVCDQWHLCKTIELFLGDTAIIAGKLMPYTRETESVTENPLIGTANRCFACGDDNPIGLKIAFSLQDETCSGLFTPGKYHVGFNDTVHGGIIFAALDDVMANLLYLQGIKAFTARCEIRYRKALRVGQTLQLRSEIVQQKRRLYTLAGTAHLAEDGELIADASASFMSR